jgi:hypothetical protein
MDMYVKDIGLSAVDFIGTRIEWRALVNMVRNIRFLQTSKDFLTN